MINQFDKSNLGALRADLMAALKDVEAKHGVSVSIGNMRYTTDEVRAKITVAIKGSGGVTNSDGNKVGTPELLVLSAKHGLPTNLLGRKVNYGGKILTIVGAKLSRTKFPFTVEGPQGGRYKMSVDHIRNGLV